jgi:acyl-homoserine lactone acylase PvdQ
MHVVSEQGLNAYGAVTWGQFFIYQGFNEHTGWMHTSTDVDFMDEFAEQVFEANGSLAYRYGDEVRPVSVSDVTLRYRDGVALKERTFPLYRTHHGPVTHAVDGRWVATKLNWDPVNALIQSFTRTKLHNHDEFREMMNIRRNSSNNTVYADSSGNIAYYHGNFVPRRDVSFDYAHPVDGSNPATDWQGLHEVDELVTILNPPNGWIQNCNSTPFTAAGPFSPKRADYPYYMAPDHENFRGINAVRLLTGVSDVTLDSLIDIAYETYLPGFESLVPGLIQAFDEAPAPPERLRAPIDALRTWDLRVGVDSVAMTLAHFYGERFMDEGNLPASLADASFIDQLTFHATQTDVAERLAVFGRVLDRLEKDFGRWDVRWGEVNRYQRLTGDIDHVFRDDQPSLPIGMASNSWGALASFSASRYEDSRKIYGRSGNSFVAVVEFGDKLSAKTLLAGGQSGDPDSPHFDDQARRYADRVFKDVAFYRAEVDARATRTYHPGE